MDFVIVVSFSATIYIFLSGKNVFEDKVAHLCGLESEVFQEWEDHQGRLFTELEEEVKDQGCRNKKKRKKVRDDVEVYHH